MTIFVIVGVVIICSFLSRILPNFHPANHGAAVFADVTSANVVGYAGSDLYFGTSNNRTVIVPQFTDVSQDTICLRNIKPISSATVANKVNLYTLMNTGKTDKQYRWNGTIWVDPKNKSADSSDVPLPEGKGLWMVCTTDAATQLQSSGEVNTTKDIVVRLKGGTSENRTVMGNGLPIALKMKDIIPEPVTAGVSIANKINAYTLLNTGKTDKQYRWNGTKWVDPKNKSADSSDVPVPAGASLWVVNTVEEDSTIVNMRVANPLAPAK